MGPIAGGGRESAQIVKGVDADMSQHGDVMCERRCQRRDKRYEFGAFNGTFARRTLADKSVAYCSPFDRVQALAEHELFRLVVLVAEARQDGQVVCSSNSTVGEGIEYGVRGCIGNGKSLNKRMHFVVWQAGFPAAVR